MKSKLYLFKPLSGIFGPIEINKWYNVEIGTNESEVYVMLELIGPNLSEYSITFWNDEHKEFLATIEEFRDNQINKIIEL